MATDKTSDVALVNVPEDLPVAPFADDAALQSGTPDLALSFVPRGAATPSRCTATPGAVTAVGAAITSGPGHACRPSPRHQPPHARSAGRAAA